jgi:hypothetical protein
MTRVLTFVGFATVLAFTQAEGKLKQLIADREAVQASLSSKPSATADNEV